MSQILEALVIAAAALGGSFLIASVVWCGLWELSFLRRRIVTEYPHGPRIEYPADYGCDLYPADDSDKPPRSMPHSEARKLYDGGLSTRRISMKRLVIALALLASAATAYNASDYYAAGLNYWQAKEEALAQRAEWRSENYYIGTFGCYICFHKVDFWQAKGVSPCGAKATCGNCGHTNTYRHDTLLPD